MLHNLQILLHPIKLIEIMLLLLIMTSNPSWTQIILVDLQCILIFYYGCISFLMKIATLFMVLD